MKLFGFFVGLGTWISVFFPALAFALQCDTHFTNLVVSARTKAVMQSRPYECLLAGEAVVHLKGRGYSSLVRASGYLDVIFLDGLGRFLRSERHGPWLGAFAGLPLDVAFSVPAGARRIRIVAKAESGGHGDSSGEWRVAALSIAPGVAVSGEAVNGGVLTLGQSARWRLFTQPKMAPGEFQVELLDLDGRIKGRQIVRQTGTPVEVNFGKLELGYYELRVHFLGGASRANVWKNAVVVLPNDVAPREARFGMDAALSWWHGGKPESVVLSAAMMRRAGIGAVRDRFRWEEVQPKRQMVNWGNYAKVAAIVAKAGIEQVQMFHDSPPWTHPAGRTTGYGQPPLDYDAVYEFGRAFAQGLGKTVRSIEYWNEENAIEFFMGYPFQYASGLKAFSAGVKSVDPDIRVLIGAPAGMPGTFFQEIYGNGVANFFDVRNQHYYGYTVTSRSPENADRFYNEHVATVDRRWHIASKPGWLTESGYALLRDNKGDWRSAELEQAEVLVEAYAEGFAAGYERVFFFFWGEFVEGDALTWGIVRKDFSPRPAYLALSLLTRHLAGAELVAVERHGTGRSVFFRRKDGRFVAITWGGGAPIERFSGSSIVDVFGRPVQGASPEVRRGAPLLISGIARLPAQAMPLHLPKSALLTTPPLWLESRMKIDGHDQIYQGGNRVNISVHEGGEVELEARAHGAEGKASGLAVECLHGPGLKLRSPVRFVVDQSKFGRPFSCQYRANLTMVGESFVSLRAGNGLYTDVVRIALRPDAISASSESSDKLRPFMPYGACPSWTPNHSKNLALSIRRGIGPCAVEVTDRIERSGNSWVFPFIHIPDNGLVGAKGMRLKIGPVRGLAFAPAPVLLLQLVEKSGGIWAIELQGSASGYYSALFSLAHAMPWGRDDNGRLDLGNVGQIMIGWGGHEGLPGQQHGFSVDSIELMRE